MKFEDLTQKDLINIASKVPPKWTLDQMKDVVKKISDNYQMPDIDASTAFFVAYECKEEYEQINRTMQRRLFQLSVARAKAT